MPDVAGDASAFKHSVSDKEECKPPYAVESTPSTLIRGTAEDRYVTSADGSLGLNYWNIDVEVMKKKVIIDQTAESEITHLQAWGSRSRWRSRSRRMRVKSSPFEERGNFPPLLSTLNINGRQRYDFIRSVEDKGRLTIRIKPNEHPELVAQVDESGRLRLILITSRSQFVVEHDDDEEIEEGIVECCIGGGGGGGDIEQKLHGARWRGL